MNAYYSEILFAGTDDELNVPGVATLHPDGKFIEISPIGRVTVTRIALDANGIVALVKLADAHGLLSTEKRADLRKTLK